MPLFLIRKQRSFALIEMLVVIAIIGILAGIVLVALGGARTRARDARIQAGMSQIRSAAELHYSIASNSYTGFSCATTNPDMVTLCADIDAQNGAGQTDTTIVVDVSAPAQKYCAEVQTNDGNWWCVDYKGVSKSYASATPPQCDATAAVYCCEGACP